MPHLKLSRPMAERAESSNDARITCSDRLGLILRWKIMLTMMAMMMFLFSLMSTLNDVDYDLQSPCC